MKHNYVNIQLKLFELNNNNDDDDNNNNNNNNNDN